MSQIQSSTGGKDIIFVLLKGGSMIKGPKEVQNFNRILYNLENIF